MGDLEGVGGAGPGELHGVDVELRLAPLRRQLIHLWSPRRHIHFHLDDEDEENAPTKIRRRESQVIMVGFRLSGVYIGAGDGPSTSSFLLLIELLVT